MRSTLVPLSNDVYILSHKTWRGEMVINLSFKTMTLDNVFGFAYANK